MSDFEELLGGRYRLERALGSGGAGAVVLAQDMRSGAPVAIKRFAAASGSGVARKRFRREAQALARLDHPHVLRVIECLQDSTGDDALVLELAPGGSLQARLEAEGPLPVEEVVALGVALSSALAHAHERGLLHRDLKPDNVLYDAHGQPKLADFGLTRDLEPGLDQSRLSKTGQYMGTPGFWPPEQAKGELDQVGPHSDVYGLAGTLYAALTGEPPQGSYQNLALALARLDALPAPPSQLRPEVPPWLDDVLLAALEPEPNLRLPSARLLGESLERRGLKTVRRPWRRRSGVNVLVAAGLLGLLAGGVTLGVARLAGGAPPDSVAPAPARSASAAKDPRLSRELTRCRVLAELLEQGRTGPLRRALELLERAPLGPEERVDLLIRARGELLPGPEPGEVTNEPDGSILVYVPPGTFLMGAADGYANERPVHEVRFARGFLIGKYEVTWKQYLAYCDARGLRLPKSRIEPTKLPGVRDPFSASGPHPVFNVSWKDAQAYCAWAGLRLPTEAEWEYAARGTDGRLWPWGSEPPSPERLNSGDRSSQAAWDWPSNVVEREVVFRRQAGLSPEYAKAPWDDGFPFTAPVGSFPAGASPFGCLDMAGNVWEWTADSFVRGGYQDAPTDGSARDEGFTFDNNRVYRGGNWFAPPANCRTTDRYGTKGGATTPEGGFRVARDLPE